MNVNYHLVLLVLFGSPAFWVPIHQWKQFFLSFFQFHILLHPATEGFEYYPIYQEKLSSSLSPAQICKLWLHFGKQGTRFKEKKGGLGSRNQVQATAIILQLFLIF